MLFGIVVLVPVGRREFSKCQPRPPVRALKDVGNEVKEKPCRAFAVCRLCGASLGRRARVGRIPLADQQDPRGCQRSQLGSPTAV
jgi:hypothetical protein